MLRPLPLRAVPRYPVTGGVVALAIVATLLWWSGRDVSPLMMDWRWWPNEPWRTVTSALLHANVFHLLFNLYWLWVFGTVLEQRFGSLRTGGIMLLFGLGSSMAEYAFFYGGVGLSGVGYGLFGFLWVLSEKDRRFSGMVDRRTVQLFVGWFFLCIVLTALNVMNVANIAHAAGAILGVLLGFCVAGWGWRQRAASVSLVGFMLWTAALATVWRPYVNFSRQTGDELAYAAYEAQTDGDNEKAVQLYRQALDLNKTDSGAWFNLGIALESLDRLEEAVKAYETAAKLDAEDAAAIGAVAHLKEQLAARALEEGDDEEARRLYQEALAGYEQAVLLEPEGQWTQDRPAGLRKRLADESAHAVGQADEHTAPQPQPQAREPLDEKP